MSVCCNSYPIFGRDIKTYMEKRQLLQMVLRKLVSHIGDMEALVLTDKHYGNQGC